MLKMGHLHFLLARGREMGELNHMLAPPITRENAADYARRATISRENNRRILREKAKAMQTPAYANSRAVAQVNKVLRWMEDESDREEYAKLAAILDRLWNKAYPTQGAVKSGRSRQVYAPAEPDHAPIQPAQPGQTPQG